MNNNNNNILIVRLNLVAVKNNYGKCLLLKILNRAKITQIIKTITKNLLILN